MAIHPEAGKPVAKESLIDVAELISLYYELQPDVLVYLSCHPGMGQIKTGIY